MPNKTTVAAFRTVAEVVAGRVTVRLPAGFTARRVEVIVLPAEEDEQDLSRLPHLLLNAPTLSDAELQAYAEVRAWMNRWSLSEF